MRLLMSVVLVCCLLSPAYAQCPAQPNSSSEAIERANEKNTDQEKIDYLLAQSTLFLDQKKYDDAISTATYVLSLDPENAEAMDILEQAETAQGQEQGGVEGIQSEPHGQEIIPDMQGPGNTSTM